MGNSSARIHINSPMSSPTAQRNSPARQSTDLISNLVDKKAWDELVDILLPQPEVASIFDPDTNQLLIHKALGKSASLSLIKALLLSYPEGLFTVDYRGMLPIHYACVHNATVEVIEFLLSDDLHKGTDVSDEDGRLPLHCAVTNRCSSSVVQALIISYPSGLQKKTKFGYLPIHLAAKHRAPLDCVSLLISGYPDGLRESIDGKLPLHFACENKASDNVVEEIIKKYLDAVSEMGTDGMFPIHHAAANKPSLNVIKMLIREFKGGMSQKDRNGRLALHYSLEKSASEEVVLELINSAPDTGACRGYGGNLPLHTALDKHFSHIIINALLEVHPRGAAESDMHGTPPIRKALTTNASAETVSLLLKYAPTTAGDVDECERCLVHYAASRKLPLEIVKNLIAAHPAGVRQADQHKQLPLHLSVLRDSDPALVMLFLQSYPEGILMPDCAGYLAVHYAVQGGVSLPLLQLLLNFNPLCAQYQLHGKYPLHLAVEFKRDVHFVDALLQAYPLGAQQRDAEKGRLALCWAMERFADVSVLLALEASFHDGCSFVEDIAGYLPIHYAIRYRAGVAVVHELLCTYPQFCWKLDNPIHNSNSSFSISCNNVEGRGETDGLKLTSWADNLSPITTNLDLKFGGFHKPKHSELTTYGLAKRALMSNRLLLHYAVEDMEAMPGHVAEIMLLTMPLSHVTGKPNPNHHYTWTYILSQTKDIYWEAVETVLSFYKHQHAWVQYLNDVPDEQGHKAIEIATPKCKFAILRRLYYCGRYDIHVGPYQHQSRNSLVRLATDHDNHKKLVAIKFMKYRVQFDREVSLRAVVSLLDDYVIPLLAHYDGDADIVYREETIRKGYSEYPYAIVMQAAERDLIGIMLHENFAGFDWGRIRQVSSEVLSAIAHIHQYGFIHGDIKPLNIMRHDDKLKFIDLGASVSFAKGEYAGGFKSSSAFLAPEMQMPPDRMDINSKKLLPSPVLSNNNQEDDLLSSEKYVLSSKTGLPMSSNAQSELLLADPSMDMWSFGVLFYYLCTGESLLLSSVYDTVDNVQTRTVLDWPDHIKTQRLAKVVDLNARNMLFELLSKDSRRRPTATCLLLHPFFTGTRIGRFPGMLSNYDVFICYRWQEGWHAVTDSHTNEHHHHHHPPNDHYEADKDEDTTAASDIEQHDLTIDLSPADEHVLHAVNGLVTSSRKQEHHHYQQHNNLGIISFGIVDDNLHVDLTIDLLEQASLRAIISGENVNEDYFVLESSPPPAKIDRYLASAVNMVHSKCCVILLSRFSVNDFVDGTTFETIGEKSDINQVLFDCRLALELRRMGLLEAGIIVILVGDMANLDISTQRDWWKTFHDEIRDDDCDDCQDELPHEGSMLMEKIASLRQPLPLYGAIHIDSGDVNIESSIYNTYYASYEGQVLGRFGCCHPRTLSMKPNLAVETQLRKVLTTLSLGSPMVPVMTVQEVVTEIIACPSVAILGPGLQAWQRAVDEIVETVHNATAAGAGAASRARTLSQGRARTQSQSSACTSPSHLAQSPSKMVPSASSAQLALAMPAAARDESAVLGLLTQKITSQTHEIDNLQEELASLTAQLHAKNIELANMRFKLS